MTTSPRSSSPSGWAALVVGIAAVTVCLALLFSPFYVVLVPFWAAGAWALFWVIRLAVRRGVDDALQENRQWLAHPTREAVTRD